MKSLKTLFERLMLFFVRYFFKKRMLDLDQKDYWNLAGNTFLKIFKRQKFGARLSGCADCLIKIRY